MSMPSEARESLRLLQGLEEGRLNVYDAFQIVEKLDPVYVYFTLKFLREKYGTDQANPGVLERMLELSKDYPKVVQMMKQGEGDILREWFEESYKYSDYFDNPEDFMQMIAEKFEG